VLADPRLIIDPRLQLLAVPAATEVRVEIVKASNSSEAKANSATHMVTASA